jgi:hypothetical protein
LALIGMQNRTFGPYFAAIDGILVSVVQGADERVGPAAVTLHSQAVPRVRKQERPSSLDTVDR